MIKPNDDAALDRVRAGLKAIVDMKNPMPRAAVREACAELLAAIASTPSQAVQAEADIGPYKGPMVVDASLLHALWCYGNLSPVEGVVYSYGKHQKCLDDADKLLFDRAAALASAATRTGEQ